MLNIFNSDYARAYLMSFLCRVVINFLAAITLLVLMNSTLEMFGTSSLWIPRDNLLSGNADVFATASYVFDEATIIISLSGLLAVVLVALLSFLGTFVFSDDEPEIVFRLRLFIYTLSHLLICLALTTYLMFCVAVISLANSFMLNEATAFIWGYPTYAIIVMVYLIEMYRFITRNQSLT